jgi:hypothetical protein
MKRSYMEGQDYNKIVEKGYKGFKAGDPNVNKLNR